MSAFRIVIDRSLCSGFGACVESAQAIFDLDERGIAQARVLETDDPRALDAAAACPVGAITVHDAAEAA
jgi:ferredoxin